MFTYPCGRWYSVTLVSAHAQCILVNHKVKGCLYMSHEKSLELCERCYSVPYKQNSTTRMRSDTNTPFSMFNRVLLRKDKRLQFQTFLGLHNFTNQAFSQGFLDRQLINGFDHPGISYPFVL